MIKTQGFRKFATLMAIIFGMTMFLAACGTDSSTDEALSQPGDNFVGTFSFDVDPANESITITPVASALSNTQVSIKDGFAVTSKKPSDGTPGGDWAGGILSTNLVVKNKSASRVENVSLRIFQSDDLTVTTQATTTTMGTPGNDVIACNQVGNIGVKLANAGCLAAGGPGITVLGDKGTNLYSATVLANAGQYPTPVRECTWNGASCTSVKIRGMRVMGPGCGTGGTTATNLFALGSGATKYKFMTHLYGVTKPGNIFADPRYDVGNASILIRAYEYENIQTPSYDPTKPLTTVKSGQWFALVVGADMPGQLSRGSMNTCDNGNTTAGCFPNASLQGATAAQRDYDYYLTEDAGNIAARDAHADWQTNPASNTDWVHLDKVVAKVQWDPAVLNVNSNVAAEANCCGVEGSRPSSGTMAFVTAGGTNMLSMRSATATPAHPENQYTSVTATTLSNAFSVATITSQYQYVFGTNAPFLGDGLDGAEYVGTDIPADLAIGIVAMRVVGAAGQGLGATVNVSNSINTMFTVAIGNGAALWSADTNIILQKSNQLGTGVAPTAGVGGWYSTTPTGLSALGYSISTGENNTGTWRGSYNDDVLGICIQ